ncbi:TauD/TfdA dioxygenase family protein [Nocardia sp. alder85J]|uniref:TauD/TfdA dioxygenase family protein n=1 Tax=Nocardia sp. alder85J TaxID=2862949 RepID=UPI001CD2FA1E|nr:TauD/TfdA family dioxygenase [Nocardia sp. alder85J]MCX4092517.1 TauD/TfdA family dioxygenase [Nocardia sp. alder85J]
MPAITTKKLSEKVGVEVLDVDVARLLDDEDLPGAVLDLLEQRGVVLFRQLHAGDEAQVAFSRKLGELVQFPNYPNPNVMEISFDPANPNAKYFPSNDYWHIDGAMDEVPAKISIMSAHVVTPVGGETAFASTYAAYDDLTDAEKQEFEDIRVVHRMERIQRLAYLDPTPEQLADWARWVDREHPLVWTHETGRKSLVFGATASHLAGDDNRSRDLLDELEARATTSDRVLQHTWAIGDLVFWDNTGLVHRACDFDKSEPRRMHRSTVFGTESIK